MREDQRRESFLEEIAASRRMAADKQRLLLELRSERDRRVTVAIARAVTSSPLPPGTAGRSRPAPAQRPLADSSIPKTPIRAAPHPGDTTVAQRAAQTVDRVISDVGLGVFGTEPARPAPPGLFALALIGMFLVPALGVGLLLIGFAHLRAHSLVSGTALLACGGLLMWGTWTLAKMTNPDWLSRPTTDATRTVDGTSPIDAMRSDLYWPGD
jgi:hypothetical protein